MFSGEEQARIRQYLGFSEQFQDLDGRLESQLAEVGSRSPEAETLVRQCLARLANVEEQLEGALDNLALTRAEDVSFLGPEQLEALRQHGRNLIQRIAIVFHVEPLRDYFGSEATSGGRLRFG